MLTANYRPPKTVGLLSMKFLNQHVGYIFLAVVLLFLGSPHKALAQNANNAYSQSLDSSKSWDLPSSGPEAAPRKTVFFLAANLRNSGILGVAEGVVEAADRIGWEIEVLDAKGSTELINLMLEDAISNPPHGLVVGGFDASEFSKSLKALSDAGTSIVGWHAGTYPGTTKGSPIFFNVTTDPIEVAQVAAQHAISQTSPNSGFVIFTDSRFEIALAKSNEMENVVQSCDHCHLLEVVDINLDKTATLMPEVVDELIRKYGDAWNVTLGINDLYFDDAVVPLSIAGVRPNSQMLNVSAGDGSVSAYQRIRANEFQHATVPEPLSFQGWQVIDELNRSIQGENPSGFIAPTKLVLGQNVDTEGGHKNIFDPDNGYRNRYQEIWKAKE